MPDSPTTVVTERLLLIPFTIPLIDGFLADDRAAAERSLDIQFPEPFAPPPENGDVLGYFRSMIETDASEGRLIPRLIVRQSDRMVIGSIGVNPPDESGSAMTGYSVYPQFEGNGYASEALAELVNQCLKIDGITRIFATIPVGHIASERVSSRAGLIQTGEQAEDEGMTLNVWERFPT